MQANCVECHRTGGVAPFALEKYEEVVDHKGMIKKVVDDGHDAAVVRRPAREGQALAVLQRPLASPTPTRRTCSRGSPAT